MLANPFPPSHYPNPPADHYPDHDPFQSLYDSIANLTLTNPKPAAPTETNTTPNPLHNADNTTAQHAGPSPPEPQHHDSSLMTVTPLFPPGDNVIFAHSSFFRRPALPGNIYPDLPTPAQVRAAAAAAAANTGTIPTPTTNGTGTGTGHGAHEATLVPYPSHGLLVRHGAAVSAAEGKAMILAWRTLLGSAFRDARPGPVPVPEVFGWRRDAATGERCVYMDLPAGEVLEERWAALSEAERGRVCGELRAWVAQWRRLRLGGAGFVGSVDNGPLLDEVFRGCTAAGAPPPGPFPTAAAFHDYFVAMSVTVSHSRHAGAGHAQTRYVPQHLFPSDVPVVFTHGALHPRNIIVSPGPNPRVVAIIGWEQAGWYPAYWELCKARWECSRRGRLVGWGTKYLPWILDAEGLNAQLREWHVGALCQYWDYFVGLM